MIMVFAGAGLAECLWVAARVSARVTETVADTGGDAKVQYPR